MQLRLVSPPAAVDNNQLKKSLLHCSERQMQINKAALSRIQQEGDGRTTSSLPGLSNVFAHWQGSTHVPLIGRPFKASNLGNELFI